MKMVTRRFFPGSIEAHYIWFVSSFSLHFDIENAKTRSQFANGWECMHGAQWGESLTPCFCLAFGTYLGLDLPNPFPISQRDRPLR